MTNLTLLATIAMAAMSAALLLLIALAVADLAHEHRDRDEAPIENQLQSLHEAISAPHWPARGEDVQVDTQRPGRHRKLDAAMAEPERRPSLIHASLNEALAWLAVDHVKREAQRVAFVQLMTTTRYLGSGRPLLSGGARLR